MARPIGIDLLDPLKARAPDLLRDAGRGLSHLRYADLRLAVSEGKYATAENGAPRVSGDDYAFALGVRVLAGERMVAPGYVGLTLGAADADRLERRIRDALGRAYRRAVANGELKEDAREKFGSLGDALADTHLHVGRVAAHVGEGERPWIPRVEGGNRVLPPEEIIREVDHGFYLAGHRIPSIAESRENFRISARRVYEIVGGELGRLYRDGGLAADTRDFLMNVDAVGRDCRLYPIPNCGKGQPMQTKKLGNGGPTLRSRARVVGG